MSEEIEIELTNSSHADWTIDQIMTSMIIYEGMIENYGQPAVDVVIQKLGIHKNDLGLEDNNLIILRILNGEV